MTAAFVVAVCGPPGSGKSSVSRALAARLGNAPVIAYDAYERITAWPPARVAAWHAAGASYDAVPTPGLAEDLARLRHGEPVADRVGGGVLQARASAGGRRTIVFDTLLGRANAATGALVDHLVWLDLPPDLALVRKLRALLSAMPDAGALADYLAHYETLLRPTYAVQRDRVRPDADQILDATAPVESLAGAVAAAVAGSLQ
ncbi:uridine kinase [Methylobacterium sp. WL8]|nr:uridine kinase [Methylobacterium sp. WL8]